MQNKRPRLALFLSLILPGAGLAYLGRWRAALANFLLVHAVLFSIVFGFAESNLMEHIHYVFLGLAGASAGYAHAQAITLQTKAEPTE